jgi:LacI family transcriptional regulator
LSILVPPAGIVTRRSTDVLALPDVATAQALRYMWDRLAEPLQVSDTADAVAISRRKLERHFRKYLGRSVTEELTRKRIERSRELLTGTELTGHDIARQVGFDTQTYFGRVFRKEMGMTPGQYRLARIARLGEAEDGGPTPPVGPASLPPGPVTPHPQLGPAAK